MILSLIPDLNTLVLETRATFFRGIHNGRHLREAAFLLEVLKPKNRNAGQKHGSIIVDNPGL